MAADGGGGGGRGGRSKGVRKGNAFEVGQEVKGGPMPEFDSLSQTLEIILNDFSTSHILKPTTENVPPTAGEPPCQKLVPKCEPPRPSCGGHTAQQSQATRCPGNSI